MSKTLIIHTAANRTLSKRSRDTLVLLGAAADLIVTLPKSDQVSKGQVVTVHVSTASGGTGAQVNPASGDTIKGTGITAAADKNLINTGATDAAGDAATLVADGAGSWYITNLIGTWAREG